MLANPHRMMRPWIVGLDGVVRVGDRGRLLLILRIAENEIEQSYRPAEEIREAKEIAAEWQALPNKPSLPNEESDG